MCQRAQYLFVYRFIGFRKILTAFAVAEDHIFHFQLVEHQRAYFAGEGALLFPVHVLCAQVDIGALDVFFYSRDGNGRRADNDFRRGVVLYQRQDAVDQGLGFGRSHVHFPVTSNDRFTHWMFPP